MTNRLTTLLVSLCLATTASLTGCEKSEPDKAAADKGDKGKTDAAKPATPDAKTPAGDVKADGGETPDAEPKADGDAPAEEAKADAP